MKNKYLITSALPYVNYNLHIGHMVGCLLPSDVYARFCRAMNRDVLFVCGADEHGTTSEIGAMKEGIPVEQYVDKYRAAHIEAVDNFKLSFDLYGRTHTQLHEKLIQSLFTRLDEAGLIEEKVSVQPYSIKDEMFLADRFVIGTCPKCGYDKAYGNECGKCASTLEPSDLINPHSAITEDSPVEMRETKHLYFRASATQDRLQEWIDSRVGWPKTAMTIAHKWLDEGLRDTPITRDLKWGIPVNKPGYENKVFYVWFDAPWGYVSISQAAAEHWADWWKNDDCHYTQFMGKDNVAFHAVFFPSQELAMNDNWKTVDVLKAFNFLNFEGAKISKSTGNGIFLNDAIHDASSDAWRYALIASIPETDDTDFTIKRFAEIVNKDLNGMLGNFVSRVTKLTEKNFGNKVPAVMKNLPNSVDVVKAELNSKLAELTSVLDKCEFRKSIEILRSMWAFGNEYLSGLAPWQLIKDNNSEQAGAVLTECLRMIDFYARVCEPFIPDAARKIKNIFIKNRSIYDKEYFIWPKEFTHEINPGDEFAVPENLFERIDDARVTELTEKYSKKPADTPKIIVAKILEVASHPTKEGLSVLKVDAAEESPLQIVCGAPNVRAGFVGVLAKVGAILPGAKKPITKRAVQNVESFGMMLSAAELGIGSDADNIVELGSDIEIGSEYKF
ncbi:MAG: methionine--tRNA ligase [Rickettsiales bacterium]|jgi:methionyl-tRNA synthetase|nr:methionine--tRNA ligase [Rickettsiales bacterium]